MSTKLLRFEALSEILQIRTVLIKRNVWTSFVTYTNTNDIDKATDIDMEWLRQTSVIVGRSYIVKCNSSLSKQIFPDLRSLLNAIVIRSLACNSSSSIFCTRDAISGGNLIKLYFRQFKQSSDLFLDCIFHVIN